MTKKSVITWTLKLYSWESNFPRHEWLSAGTTLEANADFPFKQGLITRGRARFKHGSMLTVDFGTCGYEFTINIDINLISKLMVLTLLV
jgi:hypothetical protein